MTSSTDLTCQQLVALVTDHLEGALSEEDGRRFVAHLRVCEGCRRHLAQMDSTVQALSVLEGAHVPPQVEARLVALYRRWASDGQR
jgi:anti-sigma factor RsiW